jgi:hypothetical protein
MGPRRAGVHLAVSVSAILFFFAALQFIAPPDGFFSSDQGPKYLQARAFALQGPFRPGIDVASRDVDPGFRYQILLESHGGQLVGVFSWLLPMLTAPFLAMLGFRGLYVVPALSVVVLFLAAAAFGRRLSGGDGLWTAWIVVLSAPVVFYGGELWEHAPAAACVIGAALLLAPEERGDRRSAILAGALIAVAELFREEAVLALPALLVARAISVRPEDRVRDAIRYGALAGAGAVAVLLLAIPMNLVVYRSPVPLHLSSEAAKAVAHPPVRSALFAQLLLPMRFASLYVVGAVLGVAAAWRYRTHRAGDGWLAIVIGCVLVLLTIAVVVPMWRTIVFGESMYQAYSMDSIAHTWPFCIALVFLPLLGPEGARGHVARYLCTAAALMTMGALAIIPSTGGAQWSPRYLFAAAPLLAVAASAPALRVSGMPPRRAAVVMWTARLVLLCSAIAQIDGLRLLVDAKSRNARLTHWVGNRTAPGDVLITDLYWFPGVTATLAPSRRMLFSWSSADIPAMAGMAVQHGFRRFGVVTSTPLTGYDAPPALAVPGAPCRFTRGQRISLDEKGLVLNRYACEEP